jgi:hypothetical protein
LHSLQQLVIVLSLWSPSDASLLPSACQPCLYALADSDPLLLRNGGKDADDGLTEDASRVQILFCEATPVNSIAREPLQMVQRFDQRLFQLCPKSRLVGKFNFQLVATGAMCS